jgi:hypothetical protein
MCEFLADLRIRRTMPHVAPNLSRIGASAIDGLMAHHQVYAQSIHARKRIEHVFAWI